jgi:hypothetical protein
MFTTRASARVPRPESCHAPLPDRRTTGRQQAVRAQQPAAGLRQRIMAALISGALVGELAARVGGGEGVEDRLPGHGQLRRPPPARAGRPVGVLGQAEPAPPLPLVLLWRYTVRVQPGQQQLRRCVSCRGCSCRSSQQLESAARLLSVHTLDAVNRVRRNRVLHTASWFAGSEYQATTRAASSYEVDISPCSLQRAVQPAGVTWTIIRRRQWAQ